MLDLLDTTKHLQALTHYMGLYFMASRGAKLIETVAIPGQRPRVGNAKAVSINTRIRVYLASIAGTNIARNTDQEPPRTIRWLQRPSAIHARLLDGAPV